ncbi:unnamed protein product [Caenorhabditis sp. 36 PRJEB53466]|nr:unnamed protein product [Caenorhabditis sp. 36 PRJEB53466]
MSFAYSKNPWLEEINCGVSGAISVFANLLLIYAVARVKSFTKHVRWGQYYNCVFRLLFSISCGISAPTVSSKNPLELPWTLLLTMFIVFVQYFQVAYVLSSVGKHTHREDFAVVSAIYSIPILVAIPTFTVLYIGYTPSPFQLSANRDLVTRITGRNDSNFLIVSSRKMLGPVQAGQIAIVATIFAVFIMFISLFLVRVFFAHIRRAMKLKMKSSNSMKSQKHSNRLLLVQFLFPFVTIHIPFYTAFILPYLSIELEFVSTNLPYLFAWCPALNPIHVIFTVKNIRDIFPNRKKSSTTAVQVTY